MKCEDFPGEMFCVLKEKEIRLYGEYRTRRLVLDAWDGLFGQSFNQWCVESFGGKHDARCI